MKKAVQKIFGLVRKALKEMKENQMIKNEHKVALLRLIAKDRDVHGLVANICIAGGIGVGASLAVTGLLMKMDEKNMKPLYCWEE